MRALIVREIRNVRTGRARRLYIRVEISSPAHLREVLALIDARYPRWEGFDA